MCATCIQKANELHVLFYESTREILTRGDAPHDGIEVVNALLMNSLHWFRFVQGERIDGPVLPTYEDLEKMLRMVWDHS